MGMLNDLLNLNHVPRWTVTRMHRDQNVAEHAFRTAVISAEICRRLERSPEVTRECITWAIIHDADETYGGDTPSPVKDFVGRDKFNAAKEELIPWLKNAKGLVSDEVLGIVKLADVIEGYTWWQLHGDRNFRHAWIGPLGPIKHNIESVTTTAREKAQDIGADKSDLSKLSLDVCCEILGGKVQIG